MKIPPSLTILLLFPLLANAYTWQFTSPPSQCRNVSISIQGSGQPPYSLLLLYTGPIPFQKNTEFRKNHNIRFSGTSVSFVLDYPENSTFVAVVSDKSGFGTGGTSDQITVQPSSDSSCYNTSQSGQVAWYLYTLPLGLPQCQLTQVYWDPLTVNGTVSIYGTVPGGTSFVVPQGPLYGINGTDIGFNGVGFNWTVNIASGTQFILIANDDRGIASGGDIFFQVEVGENNCLNKNSPSSTLGIPPGSSYPTSTSGSTSNGSNATQHPTSTGGSTINGTHSSSNTGAIIGGVIGAVVLGLIGLFAFWFIRRRQLLALSRQRPVNVIQDDEDGNGEVYWHNLPPYDALEPFIPSNPTTEDVQSSQTPMASTTTMTTRKSSSFSQLRPINIIQHEDSDSREDSSGQGEPETIELPPVYSNARRTPRSTLASSNLTAAELQG